MYGYYDNNLFPHPKYEYLRKKILMVIVVLIIPSSILFGFFVHEYLLKENKLTVASGVIEYAFINRYDAGTTQVIYRNCLDIVLRHKTYIIRLFDHPETWETIKADSNVLKRMIVKYEPMQLSAHILHSPREVIIDDRVIIPLDWQRTQLIWMLIGTFVAFIIFVIYLYKLRKQYTVHLYWEDKQLAQQSKWKLVMQWLDE